MGSDFGVACNIERENVSTHAPAWGATDALAAVLQAWATVSTHAPAWGATM